MMIRAFFGLDQNPFSFENVRLLPHQQEIIDTLKVHCQQGGLCLVMGEPGTGKSVIKDHFRESASKLRVVPTISRTLHSYFNTIRILAQAFNIDHAGSDFKCEKRIIDEAFTLNRQGKSLLVIIDDAHLMEIHTLRKLRLLFEEFPKNHNLLLIAQSSLLASIHLTVNHDIKSRITYSVIIPRLAPNQITEFILAQLDLVKLGHNTFSEDALCLIARASEGFLRLARNLSISSLIEAVRDRKKQVDLEIVNRVLIQPHWRSSRDLDQI